MSILQKFFGSKSSRDIKTVTPIVHKVNEAFGGLGSISNDELRAKSIQLKKDIQENISQETSRVQELKDEIDNNPDLNIQDKEKIYEEIDLLEKQIEKKNNAKLDEILPIAFGIVRETAKRLKENESIEVIATDMDRDLAAERDNIEIVGDKAIYHSNWMAGGNNIKWDMVHYDVQLIGGIVLHQGQIAEMATGEGKTLVATLPVFLNALTGKGVHIVTVNDYLAKRDSEWMGILYEFHGLTVDCIDRHEPNSEDRRQAYLADITFGTNNEFGFDYLRDNMAKTPGDLVQRKHNYAIVDEVDSVLIDDARTPLIISGPTPKGDKHEFDQYKPFIQKLYTAQRTLVTNILSTAKTKLKGESSSEDSKEGGKLLLRAFRGLPKNKALIKFLSEQGMRALLQKTENFYMQEQSKNMYKIDEELYFTIDEKNNSIELTEKGHDLLTTETKDSEFFVLPDIGSQIAELEKSDASDKEKLEKKNDLMRDFSIKSERVHTVNQLLKAYTLFEKDVEYVVMDNKIKIVDEQTGRIMEGRRYSDGLHQAIEAKENVKIEAATQTYATITLQNYFRMYSKLAGMTGTAETEAGEFIDIYDLDVIVIPTNKPIIRDDRQDLVFKTKREKYNAVIEEITQLVKQGRPVLVGTTSVEISELLSKSLKLRKIKHNVLNAKLHAKEALIVAEAGQPGTVTIATNMAGRGTDIKLSDEVKAAGGLAILGTERHESRRVDRQLRGRSGRQGDPGSSQFFVSLEDDLMRLFGSERIAKLMDRLGLKEGEVIQHSMISKSIERAQKKVEENNFGVRKKLLEYDDVMNSQREVIYKKRRYALFGERIGVEISNMFFDTCEKIAAEFQDLRDFEGFNLEVYRTLGVQQPFTEDDFLVLKPEDIAEKLFELISEAYSSKSMIIADRVFPVIKNIYENDKRNYENIVIPITDGTKTLNVIANIKRSYETKGREVAKSIEKGIMLALIDDTWKEHLREMDDLKQSVQSATYEQKDPLLIYKLESFELFKKMIQKLNEDTVSFLVKAKLPEQNPDDVQEAREQKTDMSNLRTGREDIGGDAGQKKEKKKAQPVRVEKKVGRNEPCPCGSGKKYKHCHGK